MFESLRSLPRFTYSLNSIQKQLAINYTHCRQGCLKLKLYKTRNYKYFYLVSIGGVKYSITAGTAGVIKLEYMNVIV